MLTHVPTVDEFMSRHLVVVTPDMDIQKAISLLIEHRISGAPVVHSTAVKPYRLAGVLTEKDCLSIVSNGAFYGGDGAGSVRDFMTTDVVTVSPDDDLYTVAGIFMQRNFRRMPVVDEDNSLVGLVSRRDILNAIQHFWNSKRPAPPDPGYVSDDLKAKLAKRTDVWEMTN